MKTTLRPIFMIFAFSLFALLNSCTKDGTIKENYLIGKWQMTNSTDPYTEPCDFEGYLQFKDGGTYTDFDKCANQTSGGTWKLDGNILTVATNAFPISVQVKIIKLTKTELIMEVLGDTTTHKKI